MARWPLNRMGSLGVASAEVVMSCSFVCAFCYRLLERLAKWTGVIDLELSNLIRTNRVDEVEVGEGPLNH